MPLQQHITLDDGRQVKLGRIRPKYLIHMPEYTVMVTHDNRLKVFLQLGNYYDKVQDRDPPPAQVDYFTKALPAIKLVYLNDQEGDCCIAMVEHTVGVFTGNEAGTPATATDAETNATYHGICGPGDNGCVPTDVLDKWKTGITVGGQTHKIDAYVAIDWTNKPLVQVALDLFGNIQLGVNLPNGWTNTNSIWGPSSGNVGGHCIPAGCYGDGLTDANGKPFGQEGVAISTWGGICLIPYAQFCTKDFIEEAYVCLSPDWYSNGNLAPNGIDVQSLKDDLTALGNGIVPPLGPGVPPWWF
jgi:hypothetical protein